MYGYVADSFKSRNIIIKFNPKHPYTKVSSQTIIEGVFKGVNPTEHIIPPGSILSDNDELRGTDLKGADLTGITLSKVGLEDVDFSNANLTNANLSSSLIGDTKFIGANLTNANLRGIIPYVKPEYKPSEEDLKRQREGRWNGSYWETYKEPKKVFEAPKRCFFKDSICHNTKFINAYLGYTDFSNVDLTGSNFTGARLQGAIFTNAILTNVVFESAFLRKANFSNTDVTSVNFKNADLEYAKFNESNLTDANLENTNLENANLKGAHLEKANLEKASLKSANLTDANLIGANVIQANFNKTIFSNTYFSGVRNRKDYGKDIRESHVGIGAVKSSYEFGDTARSLHDKIGKLINYRFGRDDVKFTRNTFSEIVYDLSNNTEIQNTEIDSSVDYVTFYIDNQPNGIIYPRQKLIDAYNDFTSIYVACKGPTLPPVPIYKVKTEDVFICLKLKEDVYVKLDIIAIMLHSTKHKEWLLKDTGTIEKFTAPALTVCDNFDSKKRDDNVNFLTLGKIAFGGHMHSHFQFNETKPKDTKQKIFNLTAITFKEIEPEIVIIKPTKTKKIKIEKIKIKQSSPSTIPSGTQPDQNTKTKRCPKGTQKNKVTGDCDKVEKSVKTSLKSPDGPPPINGNSINFPPKSPDGPPPPINGKFSPKSPDRPPPINGNSINFSPRSPDGPPPINGNSINFSPRSPDGPPPINGSPSKNKTKTEKPKTKRCPKGTRKNKVTGDCDKVGETVV